MRMLYGYFLNRTPIFGWCVVRSGSINKHHKVTCLREIGLCLLILLTPPDLIAHTIGRACVFS